MKLRLPNKLQAALVAALASVSFTTLSTGTLAVATGTALLAGQQAQADDILNNANFTNDGNGHYTQTANYTKAVTNNSYGRASSLDMGTYNMTLTLNAGQNFNQKYDVILGSGTLSYDRKHAGTGNRGTVWVGTGTDGNGGIFTGTLDIKSTNNQNNILFGLGTSDKNAVADFSSAIVKVQQGIFALASKDVKIKELTTTTAVNMRYTAGNISQNAGSDSAVPFDDSNTHDKATASDRGKLTVGKLTMSGTTVGNYIDFILTGTGSTISGSTFGTGDTITVDEDADVTFSGAITLTSTIKNSGTVTFSDATVTMNCGLADLAGSNNYSDGDNGYIESANKYIVQGGTINGLTSVTIGGTVYDVNKEGAVEISNPDYTCYYLNSAGASVNVTNEKDEHSDLNHIVVNGTNDDIQIGSDVSLSTLTVGDAASVSLSGSGSLEVTGNLSLGNGAGLTIGADTTLKVSSGDAAKALMMGTGVTNNGTFEIAGNVTLDNGVTTKMTGTLKVDSGVTLKLSQSKDQPTSIASFSGVILAGGNLWSNTAMQTVNNVSAIENSQISFADYPNSYGDYLTTFAGDTNIAGDKTLTIYTEYKSNLKISNLTGAGTLSLTTANRNDSGEFMAIGSLAGFTGNISLAPGNADNPVRVTATLGNADVSMGTLSLNNNSGAASADKHTFFKLTGEHDLTLKGIDGTSGEVSLAVPTLTLDTDTNHSYTGSLAISGQLVKTGSGAQTLGGFAINKTILVQGGTLTLNGTYTLDGLADDAGRTYTFQDEKGDEADEKVGGFRITNGTKTVYTKSGDGAVDRAEGTKFQLDGRDVTVDENGVYKFPASADKTTLWVNGSTLSYDAYYNASGNELNTAQVAGGATLAIGTNAVGTLVFQENDTTINLTGNGTVNAISGTGTLNLGGTVTLGSGLTVADGQTFGTSGDGTLNVGTLNANGGTTTFDSAASINRLIVNGSAAATVGGSGAVAVNSTAQDQGVEIGVGKSLTLLSANMNVAGTIHNNGNLTVGNGTTSALVKTVYFVNGNNNGGSSSFDIKAKATLVATGADTDNSHASGWVMGEWNNSTTGTVSGTLLAQNASIWGCDSTYTLNIENGGLVATKGVRAKKDNVAYTINLKEGGTLVLGGTSTPGATVLNATAGSTIGTYATSGVDYSGGIATTAVQDKAVTFDTSLYTFGNNGTVITKGDTAGALTISGAITGTAAIAKAGAGTLVLSGTNTYSGGTEVNGGTLQAASAGALGSGDVTVNAGTLELTTTTAVTGALTINNGGTLVFAGENILTAGSLAVNGAVTFDLNNITAKRGTITLATGTTEDGALTNVNVTWTLLPSGFAYQGLRAQDNAWVIDIISTGQALTWAGGTANWSYSDQDLSWLTPDEEPTPTYFTENDTAVFKAAGNPAVANITEAINTAAVEVQAGANVSLQAATGAEAASLTVAELDIAGSLATSVDVAATAVEATGADAAWNITDGTVTADSITVAEVGKLALSGTGMTVKTVSGTGTVEVGDGFTLTLSQQIDSEQATVLSILNNGTVAVALGSSQNVINMDADSTGTLEVTAGTISSQSALGDQTLKLAGGTVFAVKGSETAFASDITLAGNVAMQLKDGANATIAGAVSGDGKTLSVSGGGANQTVTFTDTVTLGGLNVSGSGEKLVFQGTGSSLGAIYAQNGAFTIQFSKAEGADSASYTFGTFDMSPTNNAATRWLIVDAGVTVQGTGSNLADDRRATIHSAWGISGGGLEVYGTLTTAGVIGMEASTAYIKGSGTINAAGLNLSNGSTTYVQDGITINITTDRGVYARNDTAAHATIHLKNATLQAKDSNWTWANTNSVTVTLDDVSTGTAFEAATGHTITLSKAMGGSGKLVKKGEGTVLANAANTYTGGTAINAGTLATNNNTALGTGDVNIAADGTLEMRSSLTIAGNLTGTGAISYTGNEAGTLSLTKQAKQNLTMDIGSAAGSGALNLTLNGNSDYNFSGNVVVNNITQSTNVTVSVVGEGDVTATGRVLTGRLVVGAEESETDAVFTLSGGNAMLVTSEDATDHTYGNMVQGYGTFKLEGGATQRLTGNMLDDGVNRGFYGTFWADGAGSSLYIDTAYIYGDQVTFMATDGGQIVLSSSVKVKETAVDNGTFELNATVETLNVSGENNTLNIGTGSVENISLGGDLKVAGDLGNFYIHSGTTGTVVIADAGKTLEVDGTAHVDGRVEFHSSETQNVEIAATRVADSEQYALENDRFDVTADTMEKVTDNDVTVANQLNVATVVNNGAGKLSLTTGKDLSAIKEVFAAKGDIQFLNVDENAKAVLDTLDLAAGRTVSFNTGNVAGEADEAAVTVTGVLLAGGSDSKLNANLLLDGSATGEEDHTAAVLDVHAMAGIGGLWMGSNVTLASGNVALSDEDMELITGLEFGGMYDLFHGVDGFNIGDNPYGYTDAWVKASDVFTNQGLIDQDYYLFYSGANAAGGKGGNVGTIYIMQMPEPTTGTLSLLALCALAARRRRK